MTFVDKPSQRSLSNWKFNLISRDVTFFQSQCWRKGHREKTLFFAVLFKRNIGIDWFFVGIFGSMGRLRNKSVVNRLENEYRKQC